MSLIDLIRIYRQLQTAPSLSRLNCYQVPFVS